ncbi:MAG TPA: hypothetical protein VLG71_00830 [Candidatus Limnocylindria bacterium]|nr:hypothetical protein [Candidatus Limnocylindria bacterium]
MRSGFFILLILTFSFIPLSGINKLYFCTAADEKHFPLLCNLIGSIHKVHFADLGEVMVFNLGFTQEQCTQLRRMAKVSLHEVELVHPDLLKLIPTDNSSRVVRGCFAWKPVVLKQALDLYPHEAILYLDAGALIRKPIAHLFEHIRHHGYFLIDCGHNIRWMTTRYVRELFELHKPERQWILDETTCGVAGGFQGITRAIYDSYILPLYNYAKELRPFIDDGTTPNGFGTGRHDQPLFSIQARLLGMQVHIMDPTQKKPMLLEVGRTKTPFYITWDTRYVNDMTQVYQCRWRYAGDYVGFIKYR